MNKSKNDVINVNITTWKKRDKFLVIMLSNLYKSQTLLPDNVYIWLSKEEYHVLPEYLSSLEKEYDNLHIRYVKNNTYCHKRWEIFKYDNSSYNLMMDDDLIYPPTYIEEMYNAAKKHKNKVVCYFAREMNLSTDIYYSKRFIQNNKKNKLFGGLCCVPPNLFPTISFKYETLRDSYSFKCDECWVMSILIKHNIFIYGLHEWPSNALNDYEINGAREDSLYKNVCAKQNKFSSQKFLLLSNCVCAINAIDSFKKIWKEYEPEKYSNLGGISICITAYKSKDFIKETLDSIAQQSYFKLNNNWEIIIGIDGCEETLEYVKEIMCNYKNTRVYMMKSNMGTYVTTNTIMKLAKYDKLFRFDSDDIMLPDCIEKIMNTFREHPDLDVCRLKFDDMKSNKISRCGKNNKHLSRGQHIITSKLFNKFNGYRDWKCAGDYEFLERIHKFVNEYILNDIVFLLRYTEKSLTSNEKTGMKSETRKYYHKFIQEHIYTNECDAVLDKCVTNSYKKILNNKNVDKDEYILSLSECTSQNILVSKNDNVKTIKCPFISPKISKVKTISLGTYNPFSKSLKS